MTDKEIEAYRVYNSLTHGFVIDNSDNNEFYREGRKQYEQLMKEYEEKKKREREECELKSKTEENTKCEENTTDDECTDNDENNNSSYFDYREYFQRKQAFIESIINFAKQKGCSKKILDVIEKSDLLRDDEKSVLHNICCVHILLNTKNERSAENFNSQFNKGIEMLKRQRDYYVKYKKDYSVLKLHQLTFDEANQLVVRYMKRNGVGRHKGSGKYKFEYNNKTYTTIQSCADDYHISKQAMYKRLKKLNII